LCTLEAPKAISVSDLRDWAKDYGHIDNPGCAFLANIKDIENDLVALVPKNDEKTWTYRVVEKLLWQAFATVCPSALAENYKLPCAAYADLIRLAVDYGREESKFFGWGCSLHL
jgi:hypothetical protein